MVPHSLSEFAEIWCCDFEFSAPLGARPVPVCMVAREVKTRRVIRLWQEELRQRAAAPFPTDWRSLFVAYYASAEMGCFLALGWPLPAFLLDLYVEFSNVTNGLTPPCGRGLVPRVANSGDTQPHGRLTKRGNPEIRWIVSEWAVRLFACDPHAHAWARPRLRRRHQNKVRMALARRLGAGVSVSHTREEAFSLERCLAA